MNTSEHEIQNEIRVVVSQSQLATLFRANVGEAWTGEAAWQGDTLILKNPRRFTTGLPAGFHDLFGFKKVKITPDMVGKEIAIFAFIEVKKPGGRVRKEQKHIHAFLAEAGAIGGIAHSAAEAQAILKKER